MKQISINSKKGAYFVRRYEQSTDTSVMQCYAKPSTAKTRAEVWCKRAMIEEGGQGYKVISYNCMKFSAGWTVPAWLRIETAENSYLIKF